MQKYYPPKFEDRKFHCPHCMVYSEQLWSSLKANQFMNYKETPMHISVCTHCGNNAYWLEEKLLYPKLSVEPPNSDMPSNCMCDYIEAANIISDSPRGATALLRLSIQKLLKHLGMPGKNINDDIASLVQKGLSSKVQKALDFCRVVGNNAVHPGEIDLNDTPEMAHSLFKIINIIIEDQISKPKEINALYDSLPAKSIDAITKRDS